MISNPDVRSKPTLKTKPTRNSAETNEEKGHKANSKEVSNEAQQAHATNEKHKGPEAKNENVKAINTKEASNINVKSSDNVKNNEKNKDTSPVVTALDISTISPEEAAKYSFLRDKGKSDIIPNKLVMLSTESTIKDIDIFSSKVKKKSDIDFTRLHAYFAGEDIAKEKSSRSKKSSGKDKNSGKEACSGKEKNSGKDKNSAREKKEKVNVKERFGFTSRDAKDCTQLKARSIISNNVKKKRHDSERKQGLLKILFGERSKTKAKRISRSPESV